jgi:hypothetical protein
MNCICFDITRCVQLNQTYDIKGISRKIVRSYKGF